jgi:WD40 repeat protein
MFISASKDTSAKLYDADNLQCLKSYKTDRPVNSASISPKYDHVVLGGGQEAMDVTTTSTKIGKFDARFFHMVTITFSIRENLSVWTNFWSSSVDENVIALFGPL